MRANDVVIFIDSKGVSHNALVQSFRQDGNHDEPLVTLIYHQANGEPTELIDVPHIGHPSRQEPNPDLPTYALHAWKYDGEDHLEVPPDHPVHDRPFAELQKDENGNPIQKRRPIYEKHVKWHKAGKAAKNGPDGEEREPAPGNVARAVDVFGSGSERYGASRPDVDLGHPAHPETVSFPFQCASCGKSVKRIASHQGGKQWEQNSEPKEGAINEWAEHVCKQADIDAYRESLKPKPAAAPAPGPSPSELLAAGQQPNTPVTETVTEAEPGVIEQLEKDMKNAPPPERANEQTE